MLPHIDKFSSENAEISPSVIKNLFITVACIIQGKTVNLNSLKDEVGKISEKYNNESESYYRRLTRFFQHNCVSCLWSMVLNYALELVSSDYKLLYLDGTEWKIGNFKLHILFLAVEYHSVAVPVYFRVYNHKGILSEAERISFLQESTSFLKLKNSNSTIIADREFIGDLWFEEFNKLGIDFIVRLRAGQYKQQIGIHAYEKLIKKAKKRKKHQ